MTLDSLDHAINLVLTGLIYGSEVWIIWAFSRFVINKTAQPKTIERSQPSIEITIEQAPEPPTLEPSSSKQPSTANLTSLPLKPAPQPTISPEITCAPVNWKQWKVADLRKANLAKTCGVRTRPIGSRRNLPKADLIAQYEQQLKRFTKVPPSFVEAADKIA